MPAACTRAGSDAGAGDSVATGTAGATASAAARDTNVAVLQPASPTVVAGGVGPSGLDESQLEVVLLPVDSGNTPADLLITDPAGRRTGVAPGSFGSLMEIPHASYDSAPPPTMTDESPEPASLPKQFVLVTPPPGNYVVTVVGRRAGPYALEVRLTTPRGEKRLAKASGRTRAGAVESFGFAYDRAESGALRLDRRP